MSHEPVLRYNDIDGNQIECACGQQRGSETFMEHIERVTPEAEAAHPHEWERGAHMAEAFGIDGRRWACAICGALKPTPESEFSQRINAAAERYEAAQREPEPGMLEPRQRKVEFYRRVSDDHLVSGILVSPAELEREAAHRDSLDVERLAEALSDTYAASFSLAGKADWLSDARYIARDYERLARLAAPSAPPEDRS